MRNHPHKHHHGHEAAVSDAETSSAPPDVAAEEAVATAGVPPTEEAQTPTEDALAAQLRQAEEKAAEHHDAWLRAKAETENVRRRAQEDIAKASKFAIERFAKELIIVKDSLEAGLAAENPSVDSLRAGTELTLKQLIAAFEKSQLREINPVGEKFDPHFHQAISMIESDQEPNTVVNVLQKGYLLADRVLRPALVTVAQP
ncbi:nucleotide exchange factor GrpE [Dentiradicibacter hellwigii]|uniref:Protein GrpE n=1 Tax=Dentiradicibacter hellwigii TaxID=3149053 RepID=A0ABV4UFG8_9RHOO